MVGERGRRWVRPGAPGSRSSRLELFYDLVFVFAFLNVTTLAAKELDASTLLSGLVVLGLLWWCWTSFTFLGNLVRADYGIVPLIGFATMVGVFLLALTVPQAFVDAPGGLFGPAVFAFSYFFVRMLQVTTFSQIAGRLTSPKRPPLLLLGLPVLVSSLLIMIAAFVPQRLTHGAGIEIIRIALWSAALAVEYVAGALIAVNRWTLVSAGHLAERHSQILLIALGESVLALGLGPGIGPSLPITWPVVVASILGIMVIAALWWTHFDLLAPAVEQALHGTRDASRGRLVRDVYTYLHLPLVLGIMTFSLGLKRLLVDISSPTVPAGRDTLGPADLYVLYGGVALYLLASVAVTLRTFRRVRFPKVAAAALVIVLAPAADRVQALVALALLTAITLTLVALELANGREARLRVHASEDGEQEALEAEASRWRQRHL
ncbi:low temperature requirement protein A [Micromonospora sp. WMMD961]|uniref:low temperature requirement protein A n=1 Tax=Micromonospora sp. WMMD961 TaxID=3016100 RepID=UPI002416CD78|nr:low temperature requirement protein A [Micromonospora sp. WMMD961]MDG4782282.1 low temperature requirement protein A [Micromonospora sp. WMMD961]